jgi:hypothetical protein
MLKKIQGSRKNVILYPSGMFVLVSSPMDTRQAVKSQVSQPEHLFRVSDIYSMVRQRIVTLSIDPNCRQVFLHSI